MNRRLARPGRLGQRVSGRARAWSPAAIPDLEGWWSADNALASVGPDVAARPGDRVRSVKDSSKHRRAMDQTTANRQPILGYLRPPKGNLLKWSSNLMDSEWRVAGVVKELLGEDDPYGNAGVRCTIEPEGAAHYGIFQNITEPFPVGSVPGITYRWSGYVKVLTEYPLDIGGASFGQFYDIQSGLTINDGWVKFSVLRTSPPSGNNGFSVRCTDSNNTGLPRIYAVSSLLLTPVEWSPEYVATESEPVIPDTSELQRALVFDGVAGNMLETGDAVSNSTDITVVAVHGLQRESPSQMEIVNLGGGGADMWSYTLLPTYARRVTRHSAGNRTSDPAVVRHSSLDTVTQNPGGSRFRYQGGNLSEEGSGPSELRTLEGPARIGSRSLNQAEYYCNGPLTDVLYFTRALGDDELRRVEDYFLIKSGINRIVAEESEVKELEDVKALAPGIWYLDGEPLNEEPLQKIEVPFGSAGKQLTVGDSYGIEVLP